MRVALLSALVYGAAVFLPMLWNSFYRDDFRWVERALVASRHPAQWFLLAGTDFRPLASLSFMLNLALGGLDPAGYYAFNLGLHLANVVLLMALVRRLGGGSAVAAGVAGLVFAGAVGNYGEAVLWICGRTGPIADFFMLLSLVAHWDWRERGRGRDRAASIAAFALALLGKESAVTLLPLLFLLDRVHAGARGVRPAPAGSTFAPHAALLGAYVAFQFGAWRAGSPIVGGEYDFGLHAAANLHEYLVRMFLPIRPDSMLVAAPPELVPALSALRLVLGLAVPIGLLLLLLGRAPRAVKFGAAWIVLDLLPVVFFTYRTSARYLYGPSMGLAIVLGLAGAAWWARAAAGRARWGRPAAVGVLASLLVVQGCVMQVVLRRHAALQRAEAGPGWERLRETARSERPELLEEP